MIFDFCVVGGGIVGLATAWELLKRQPGARLVVLEKESGLARHQTGHNSGVIHAGIYYTPDSLKAKLCRLGAAATKAFAQENGIPFEVCGKLVVATSDVEMARLATLEARASQNAITFERVDASGLTQLEPNIVGHGALLVHDTGIIDYARVCAALAARIRSMGGEVRLSTEVIGIRETADEVEVTSRSDQVRSRHLVVCGGLQSDRLARLAGLPIQHRIVPFRGEYFALAPALSQIVSRLIYPVPEPGVPFLGVHLTRMIDGSVTVGPNAVLGWSREGYKKGSVSIDDALDFASFGGFWRMAARYWRSAANELHSSINRAVYLEACRKYCPSLTLADLRPYRAGIRAQAVDKTGKLIEDFLFLDTARSVHVCNAPSPAATSALPIGQMIADRALAGAP
jgi:L-2-hydroxyglutarate oxidase